MLRQKTITPKESPATPLTTVPRPATRYVADALPELVTASDETNSNSVGESSGRANQVTAVPSATATPFASRTVAMTVTMSPILSSVHAGLSLVSVTVAGLGGWGSISVRPATTYRAPPTSSTLAVANTVATVSPIGIET